jgi:hypothetical protein
MLYFKDVPVVIEPGVAALEVSLISATKKQRRLFFVPFERVELTADIAKQLPIVVSSNAPHVFTMNKDLDASLFLLVYDYLGRLKTVYSRDSKTKAWQRNDAAPEQIGETVTQFSVRLSFNDSVTRDRFLDTLNRMAERYTKHDKVSKDDTCALLRLVTASTVGPVVLPIAVAKNKVMPV